MSDRLAYSAEQLADLIGIPPETIRDWRSRDKGPRAVRIGRHVRYLVWDVDEWLRSRPEKGPGPAVSVQETLKRRASAESSGSSVPDTQLRCHHCGRTAGSDTLPPGWIVRDHKTACVACSYTQ